jgi:hypothetical protein
VGGSDRLSQPLGACARQLRAGLRLEQRQLAHREREVLGQTVVDLRRQPQALALDRPALKLLPQVGCGDAGGEQVPEQAQQGCRAFVLSRISPRGQFGVRTRSAAS